VVEALTEVAAAIRSRQSSEAEAKMRSFRLATEAYWKRLAPAFVDNPLRPFGTQPTMRERGDWLTHLREAADYEIGD
jgi:hypothetical protein